MANAFSKEEIVAFENILEGFNDALILSKNINIYNTNGVTMERARDTMWRPQPYIAQSFTRTVGSSIASNVSTMTQLSVPSTLGFSPCSAWEMNALELRDASAGKSPRRFSKAEACFGHQPFRYGFGCCSRYAGC
jgi:hypothetical protein